MAGRGVTKRKIVDAAWRLFHEKGYHDTTIEDIISASGTSILQARMSCSPRFPIFLTTITKIWYSGWIQR